MSATRFKKIKWILITVVVIKLAMMFVFLPSRSEKSMMTGDAAMAQDQPAAEAPVQNAETTEPGSAEEATTPEADPQVVLDGLEEKRKMLMEKEEQLKLEEERLAAYKKEIEEKIEKLSAVYRQIEEGLAKAGKKRNRGRTA